MQCSIITLQVGILGTNCYIYREAEDHPGWIIDPGGDADRIITAAKQDSGGIAGILLTHIHFDHILALTDLYARFDGELPVYTHEEGRRALGPSGGRAQIAVLNSMSPGLGDSYADVLVQLPEATDSIREDGTPIPGTSLAAFHTPGHAREALCYISTEQGVIFSGDTLFRESIGRSDFSGGNSIDLKASIRNILYSFPDEMAVFPGHGEATTLGHEKRSNPFVRG